MTTIPAHVAEFLKKHDLTPLEFEPGSTPTAQAAAQKIGVPVGQIAKSILFKGKDSAYRLVVAAGDRRISSGELKRVTGVKHRMANSDETFAATGCRPGGVCPFGLEERQVEILIDGSLYHYDTVYPAAGTDATGVPVTPERLTAITAGTRVSVTQKT